MTFSVRILAALLAALAMVSAAYGQNQSADVRNGVAAYRAGDDATAWQLLQAGADGGSTKAQRYLAYLILEGRAPELLKIDVGAGVEWLKRAAKAGDYAALVRLEDLRREHLAHSPSLQDLVDIEIARAERGDPVSAWRLAARYEAGDGVAISEMERAKWLEVAASAQVSHFPKAGEAAFQLCEVRIRSGEARDPDAARRWCAVAANNGHAGAAIVLRQLASLQN